MTSFENEFPTVENYWRAIILFGRNVASYKFALAKTLLELAYEGKADVTYAELALPYSNNLIEHIKSADKQGTSGSSKFLTSCRKFSNAEISQDELLTTTVKLGFNNVIDAFHIVNGKPTAAQFFQESTSGDRLVLTDTLLQMAKDQQFRNLPTEVESRWKLVETAWAQNIATSLISISYDDESKILFTKDQQLRRINITSCRGALNGYQKGKCFYCFSPLSISDNLYLNTEVDHFFPHTLKQFGFPYINQVFNLVLSCVNCNRGAAGKSAHIPSARLLERLHKRNEFLISSHHPLRETLIGQTGATEERRRFFLQGAHRDSLSKLIHTWEPAQEHEQAF